MDTLFLEKVDLKIRNITRYTEAHFVMTKNSLVTALKNNNINSASEKIKQNTEKKTEKK